MAESAHPSKVLIEPTLFDYIHEVADKIKAKPSLVEDELRGTDRLVLFLENLVAQFAANVLGVSLQGLSGPALEEWVHQRRLLESRPDTASAQRLMYALEKVFTLVTELSYGAANADLRSFRVEYLPEVMSRIVDWVVGWTGAGSDLVDAARRAQQAYEEAVMST